jgi:hypothetical protein
MPNSKKLNSYRVVYQNVTPSGIVGPNFENQKIEAKNPEDMMAILKANVFKESGNSIRVNRVENLDAIEKKSQKPKRSKLGFLAVGIFVLALAARLFSKLF